MQIANDSKNPIARFSTFELDLLAIAKTLERFRSYLRGIAADKITTTSDVSYSREMIHRNRWLRIYLSSTAHTSYH